MDTKLWLSEEIVAIQAVLNINQEIYELDDDDYVEFDLLTYSTDGYGERINFLGNQIWSSEGEGDRIYIDEDADLYEPLEEYLRRTINSFVEKVSKIDLEEN